MKKDDAEAILEILLIADGGCKYCVSNLLSLFCKKFPEFKELAEKAFVDKFGIELEDFIREAERGISQSKHHPIQR
jgi:hypothetical protein